MIPPRLPHQNDDQYRDYLRGYFERRPDELADAIKAAHQFTDACMAFTRAILPVFQQIVNQIHQFKPYIDKMREASDGSVE